MASYRGTALLLLASFAALAQQPTLVRLRDAVGDTIDLAERDSFHLFPNTAAFQHAVILVLPGPEYCAEVARADSGMLKPTYYRILPGQLDRIRFLIDNRRSGAEQLRSDSSAASALAAFWREIEGRPLQSIAREPAVAQSTTRQPDSPRSCSGSQPQPTTWESRYNYTLHGTALGSCTGSCVGSLTGIEEVSPGGGPGYACEEFPVYAVNPPVFWTVACGLTALGSTVGYVLGAERDGTTLPTSMPTLEGLGWRTGLAIGAAIPGFALGAGVAALAGGLHFGVTGVGSIENDPQGLTALPGVLTGLCVAVEVATIGYRIGREIDRSNAEKAAAKRHALNSGSSRQFLARPERSEPTGKAQGLPGTKEARDD